MPKKAKEAPCWASNSMDRDKENYIRCSTGSSSQSSEKDKKDACCSTAFRMRMAKEAQMDGSETDKMCAPSAKGKKKIKVDKDKLRSFTANMICMKLNMPGQEFDCPSMLAIQAKICKGCNPLMCPERINVNSMPSEPSAQFSMLPECLDKALSEGITLSVKYKKKEIGRGCYVLPDPFIVRITNTAEEVVHTAQVELTCKGCTVGMCTVRLSMAMQCGNIEEDASCGDHRRNAFEESESSTDSSDTCRGFISDVDQSDESTTTCTANELNLDGGKHEVGDKTVDVAGPYNVYNCEKDDACKNVEAMPGPGYQFSANARGHLGEANTNRMCSAIGPPALKQTTIMRGRVCPMCKEDVNWLPKVAACPHCGYKPVPVFEETEYDEKVTAENIIVDLLQQPDGVSTARSECSEVSSPKNSDEAFDNIVSEYKTLKRSLKKSQNSKVCEYSPKKQRSPNLITIFSEMQKLFEASSDETVKMQKIKEICDEACKLSKSTKKRRNKRLSHPSERHKMETKATHKPPVKSRLYTPVGVIHVPTDHTRCSDNTHRVPAHMGWMWTSNPLAQKFGWRPGLIRRSIRDIMSYFLKDYPADCVPVSKYMSYYKRKTGPPPPVGEKPCDLVQEPTLHISKKNNEYIITLRPLKDTESLKNSANPYVQMKPVQFRIVKNPILKQMRDMKRCLKNMGFSKCQCHRPVMECYCRSFIDKKRLVDAVHQQCQKRQLRQCEDDLVLSDTTDSEEEFDFAVTPPAGLIHPERIKVADTVDTWTQYNENDWSVPSMFPHPPNAMVQYGACVLGERKDRFPWIFGKGYVHQEPKPPKMRNKPKKPQKGLQ